MNKRKLLQQLIQSRGRNVLFIEFTSILEAFGFKLDRINGSHHIFVHRQKGLMISAQCDGKDAKAYQVKQFLTLIERNNLKMED